MQKITSSWILELDDELDGVRTLKFYIFFYENQNHLLSGMHNRESSNFDPFYVLHFVFSEKKIRKLAQKKRKGNVICISFSSLYFLKQKTCAKEKNRKCNLHFFF